MTIEPRILVGRLLSGVANHQIKTVRDAWRELLRQEGAAVAAVKAKLDTDAWKENPRGYLTEYLGILLALLHELDPVAFREEVDRLSKARIHQIHRLTVSVLAKRCLDVPLGSIGDGIPVYVSEEIEEKSTVIDKLKKWSRAPQLGLDGVTRIDVIPGHSQFDYLGLYRPDYSGIVLTWREEKSKGIRLWWRNLEAEMTFYHEVGHHACGHVEGGQVEEQEREANRYMGKMFKNAHPVMFAILKTLYSPIKIFRKRILPKIRKRGEPDF